MTWQQQIIFSQCEREPVNEGNTPSRMSPGLGGEYDAQLREKAGVRTSPIPPDCMGLEGEFDPVGLAKRVAQALDQSQQLADLDTITLIQKGNKIVYQGQVPNRQILDEIVKTTAHVDGTHAVDTDQVVIGLS